MNTNKMISTRTTRSNASLSNEQDETKNMKSRSKAKPFVNALQKVFFISKEMLEDDTQKLILEKFFHPGKGTHTYFMTRDNTFLMEVLQHNETHRCWFLDDEVCSDGRIFFTTPIDVTFLALPHLRKHCTSKAMALDNIHDEDDETVGRLMTYFVNPNFLACVADVKTLYGVNYFKYNQEKTLLWLSTKTKRVVQALKENGIHCGQSAISRNYTPSEMSTDETIQEMDYLRVACDYVGSYLTMDLQEQLIKYLKIPSQILPATSNKRKSSKSQKESMDKKQKLSNGKVKHIGDAKNSAEDSAEEDKEFVDNVKEEEPVKPVVIKKERILNAKEKSLAKGAKGTKNIASFFSKKS